MIISTKQLICLDLLRYVILCRRVSPLEEQVPKNEALGDIFGPLYNRSLKTFHLLIYFCLSPWVLFLLYSAINNLQTCSLYFVTVEYYFISLDRHIHVQMHYTMQRNDKKLYEMKTVNFIANYVSRTSCLFISWDYAAFHYTSSLVSKQEPFTDNYRFLLIDSRFPLRDAVLY